jgi:DNA-binding beta-propeller fold protein YncE
VQTFFALLVAFALLLFGGHQPQPVASTLPSPSLSPGPSTSPSSSPSSVVVRKLVLPVADFGRIVVDGSTMRVFVSSPGSNQIVVLDVDGNLVGEIKGEAGADAMVVDGTTLYVTLRSAGKIDEIDTRSLRRIKTLAPGLINPNDLVMAGGRLWTPSGNCGSESVKLARIDPASGAATLFPAPGDMSYCAAFAPVSPKRPNLIIGWSIGLSPATVTALDVSTGQPLVLTTAREDLLGNLQDVAITPDGNSWIAASGAPYNFPEFSVSNLAQDGIVYPAQYYPAAVAVTGA